MLPDPPSGLGPEKRSWRRLSGMKAVIQRVKQSSVTVDDTIISSIGPGMLVLLGVAENDAMEDARYLKK